MYKNFKVIIKSSYVISLINLRECKLYQVITASKPNYSYCTYVFLLFRDFYKCNIHHPFSQGGVISKISVCSYNYIFQHTCMPWSGDIITNKRDIWRQMALMKKALKPLIPLIWDHTPQITDSNDINVTKLTVNNFYKTLTEHSDTKKCSPFQVWENIIGQSCDCKAALQQKIYNVKYFKLKEFNFKVIHRILSCGINLKKWKLQDHDKCIECGNQNSILHLLYECPNSGILWRLVEECFGYSVSPYKIIFGDSEETYINFIISLICYLLYKYWLLRKNEHITLSLKYFIVNELEYRNKVYRILNLREIQVNINKNQALHYALYIRL